MTLTVRPHSFVTAGVVVANPHPTPRTTLTTQPFDSHAALSDISTIQEISVSKATEAEAKRRKEKKERRQRKKGWKEMRRIVVAGMVGDGVV